jgi:hypothetical protein
MGMSIPKHEIAKSLVGRQEHPIVAGCPCQDDHVDGAPRGLEDRYDIVPLIAKPSSHDGTEALVDDEAHLCRGGSEWDKRSVGQGLAGEQQASSDVIVGQTIILLNDLVDRGAEGEDVQDMVNREAGTSDARLAGHNPWIEADSFE